MSKDKILKRFFLVSDMHYSVETEDIEKYSSLPDVKVSVAAGDALGHTQREKIDKITEAVALEHNSSPLDAVLVLGDLSIDDFGFRNLPECWCEKFKKECMDTLPCPSYALAGNHDSHPNEAWQRMFGYEREYALEFGDVVFLMLDNFKALPAHSASGAGFTPTNTDFLCNMLEKYKGKKIFLCAHHFDLQKDSSEFYNTVKSNPDVISLFRGHTHIHKIITDTLFGNKPLIDIGGYAYMGFCREDGTWDFSSFDESFAWGYQILEIYDDRAVIYHVTADMEYTASNGKFSVKRNISDKLLIEF